MAAIATMSAETELNAVKKIEANKYCVNCDAYNKFGHGNICEKFKTFVCSNCKSAHQSFSMRVKSVSMSNWSKDEVDALREENGGGNAVAKRIWLGKWDDSQMRKPTVEDHVDYFKKFINRVYNDRAFYDEDPAAATAPPPRRKDASSSSSGSSSQRRASPPPPAVSANLLDFAAPSTQSTAPAFDAFGTSSSSSDWASSSSTAAPAAASTSPGSDGWSAFASAPASANDGFSDFAAFSAAPPAPAAAATQAFDPFGASAFATPAPVQPVSFDPFGASSSSALGQTTPTTSSTGFGQFGAVAAAPVLASGPPPGKNLSAFDELAAPNLAYGGHSHGHHHSHHHGQQQQHYGHHHGHQPQQHMGGSGGFYQQPQMHQSMAFQQPAAHMIGANSAANISAFMDPHANHASYSNSGNGYARPAQSGGRDPFAGLGLPQH